MQAFQKLTFKFSTFIALFLLPFSAFAGSNPTMVVSTSSITGVPTLSGTMLVVLSLLLFAVAVRVAKQKNSGVNKMFVTLLGVGSLSLVTGGVQIVSKADAALHGPIIDYTQLAGSMLGESTINLQYGGQGYNLITNNTPGTVVSITSIDDDGLSCGAPPSNYQLDSDAGRVDLPENETCTAGVTRLSNGASCDLFCDFIID